MLQGNTYVLTKWYPHSHAGILLGYSPFHTCLVALIINRATGNASLQLYMGFDNKFWKVPFMREVKIPPNWKYLVQCSSQRGAPENIDLKDTWFTPDLEDDPRKTPRHEPIIVPISENKNNTLALSPTKPYIHGILDSKV